MQSFDTDASIFLYRQQQLVSAVQDVAVCEWGKYGHNCDRLCSDDCGLYHGRNLRPCHKVTGKCLQGCVRGRHGDHCDQLCSPNCISTTCNQGNGGCTIGCIEGYSGYFCNITTGVQTQTTVSTVQGVPVCEWGKYGHNCDRLCSDHCRLHPVRNLRHCQKDTGKCSEGCVRGRHGDHCDQLCSPNCIKNSCIQLKGECTIGCMEGYSGYFCNITTVSTVQGVPVCEWGKYGHNCDRLCSDDCGLYHGTKLRPCDKVTGKCLQGCVRGRHGDLCDQFCNPNCISTTCNQGNGGCTIGCTEGYSGYFCNITTGVQIQSTVQGVPVCEWGMYGHNCDRLCSDDCGLYHGRNLRPCHKDTGKCLQGCVKGRHGDHCDQLCNPNCISTTCNQLNGGCTIGCTEGYSGYFCNITTGVQIQSTVSTAQGISVCGWGKYGHNCDRLCSDHCGLHLGRNLRPCDKDTGMCLEGCVRGRHADRCDQLCSPNCISTKCNQPNGGCTLGCIDGYIGQFCNRTGSQIQTTGEGHINLSMQLMWILLVFFIFSTMCCWKSAQCRRTLVEWFTRLIRSARCIRTLVEWFTRLIRRNPRPSSSDPSQVPLVTTQHSDRRASSDPSQDHSQSEKDPLLSTASHATPSRADRDLFYASGAGDLEEVKRLLTTPGVDINSRGDGSRTPVMEAAYRGHRDVVEILVSEGADVSLVDKHGNNILHLACTGGDVETVKYVLSLHVVDINSRGWGSWTPVMEAAVGGHRDVVELLVSEGADVSLVDEDGNNILNFACMGGDVETVKYVLSLNVVDIDARNKSGQTAADWARLGGRQPLVELLKSRGAQ
ncbi:multiple epidermal growth factor-like domains protein 6 [Haliotis cracherodii]|uniref:multiple epidermal growth factor-like domains protein 6 n=1 Tax=Haliotis cracherodii TaxID=6455 RepID=UPI0039EB0543